MREPRPASRPASTSILRLAGVYERAEACLEAGLDSASTSILRVAERERERQQESEHDRERARARESKLERERERDR